MSDPQCQACLERDQLIQQLLQQIAQLQARVRDLEERLGQNSSNSSVPPSANPLDAPKPVVKKPTGRKRGAQPDHPPQLRTRLPRQRVSHVIPLVPCSCERCQHALPVQPGPNDPEPSWHQVAELPRLTAVVTEFQGHYRTCPQCGHLNHAAIPEEIKATSLGDRLAATLGYLSGAQQLSKRATVEVADALFDVPVSVGTVAAVEQQLSSALAPAHAQAQQAVQQAAVKNVDETSWKLAGQLCWLWAAVTATVACFVIHSRRGARGLRALLGKTIRGIVGSDRWSAYSRLPKAQRQICWAHLKRDFQKLVDRGTAWSVAIGTTGLDIISAVFEHWHLFRGGGCSRRELVDRVVPLAVALRELLSYGRECSEAKVAKFCANVLALEESLWTFVHTPGVEPTNNAVERALRRAVLWRKKSFGSQSEAGCRFVERLLTVVGTLRLQQREVLSYLEQALSAHRAGLPIPNLL